MMSPPRLGVLLSVVFTLYMCVFIHTSDGQLYKEIVRKSKPCPGKYCGRMRLDNGNWSECGSCSRGFRVDIATGECRKCNKEPKFYDWLYLGFMLLLSLLLHWFCIDKTATLPAFTVDVLVLHGLAFLETVFAAVMTLLLCDPFGSLLLFSCHVEELSDWYTMFHNPNPNYEEVLHCTQEAVYPLYTMVFMFYAISLILMLLTRPWAIRKFLPKRGKKAIYAAMYFLPILSVIQAVFGGLIYYSFPYIIIILSVVSCAAHFARQLEQSAWRLVVNTVTDVREVVILLIHWCLHAYGIISITQLKDITFHGSLIALVPIPAVFYILTVRFTDPDKLHVE